MALKITMKNDKDLSLSVKEKWTMPNGKIRLKMLWTRLPSSLWILSCENRRDVNPKSKESQPHNKVNSA